MKRFLSLILSLLIVFSVVAVIPVGAAEADVAEVGGQTGQCTWTYNSSKCKLTISGSGYMADYGTYETNEYYSDVPTIEQRPWQDYNVVELVIEEGVVNIGSFAFYNLDTLKKVTIPSSIDDTGIYSFASCDNLMSVDLPDTLTTIGRGTFVSCVSLKQLHFPDKLKKIEERAFRNSGLVSADLMNTSIKSIGNYAFLSCDNMTQISLPPCLTNIGANGVGHDYAKGLEGRPEYAQPVNGFRVIGYRNSYAEIYAFNNDLSFVAITKSTVFFDANGGAGEMESVEVTMGGDYTLPACEFDPPSYDVVFSGWLVGTKVYKPGEKISIGRNTYYTYATAQWSDHVTIHFIVPSPNNSQYFYKMDDIVLQVGETFELPEYKNDYRYVADYWDCDGVRYEVGQEVEPESDMTFTVHYKLREYTLYFLPNGGSGKAFTITGHLWEDITIPECTYSHPEGKLFKCWEDERGNEYKPGDTHEILGSYTGVVTFNAIWSDEVEGSVGACDWNYNTITKAFTVSGWGSFDYDSSSNYHQYYESAESLEVENGVTAIGRNAFIRGDCLESVVFPTSLNEVGQNAFVACPELSSVDIPYGVVSIGSNAFARCDSLMRVYIPESVTSIGSKAFGYVGTNYDTKLDGFTIQCKPGTAAESYAKTNGFAVEYTENASGSVGDYGWEYDPGSMTLTVSGSGSFEYDDSFDEFLWEAKHLIVEDGITAIGEAIMLNADQLETVEIAGSVKEIGDDCFQNCENLRSITLNEGLETIGYGALEELPLIEKLTIPSTVKTIMGVSNLPKLKSITIPNGVEKLDKWALVELPMVTSIKLPNSLTYIGDNCLMDIPNMKSITVPSSVTFIGEESLGYYYSSAEREYVPMDGFTICGAKGSAAETYAKANGFRFVSNTVEIEEKTDTATGIKAEIDSDSELVVRAVAEGSVTVVVDGSIAAAYDIKLTKDGSNVQPDSSVTVSIPCSDPTAKVYRVEDDNSVTDMNAVYKDGYLVFSTDHFSLYIVTAPDTDRLLGDADNNGAVNVFDASFIQKGLTGSSGYPEYSKMDKNSVEYRAADADGDGTVNIFDAALIQKYLSGAASAQSYGIGQKMK